MKTPPVCPDQSSPSPAIFIACLLFGAVELCQHKKPPQYNDDFMKIAWLRGREKRGGSSGCN
jgi:hypothetical protein